MRLVWVLHNLDRYPLAVKPIPTPDIMGESNPAHTFSEKFRAADADVVFSSSDGVHFRIHSKNLTMNSGILGPGQTDLQAVAQLTEPASILDVLFQFVYPSRQSGISKLSPDDLFALGEAVEKYQVFPAMELCCMYIKPLASTHPIRTLSYGLKHDYPDLIDSAAPHTIKLPLQSVASAIPADRILHWLTYRQAQDDLGSRIAAGGARERSCLRLVMIYEGL
ncbi:hypothetical protein BD779DRAFT_1527367, partial [Infundibulicybe gibba]